MLHAASAAAAQENTDNLSFGTIAATGSRNHCEKRRFPTSTSSPSVAAQPVAVNLEAVPVSRVRSGSPPQLLQEMAKLPMNPSNTDNTHPMSTVPFDDQDVQQHSSRTTAEKYPAEMAKNTNYDSTFSGNLTRTATEKSQSTSQDFNAKAMLQ